LPSSSPTFDRPLQLSGTHVSDERQCSGIAHVIRDQSELPHFREGEILVACDLGADWHTQVLLARAIILEVDEFQLPPALNGELSIPVITGVTSALQAIRSFDILSIEADGSIHWLQNRRAPDSPMRVSVPAAVSARSLAVTGENVVSIVRRKEPPASGTTSAAQGSVAESK